MNGFTKLFSTIVTSTIWREPNNVRILWITMLALSDKRGEVSASIPGLADLARLSLEETKQALDTLSSPDPWSRSKEHEGRRIEEVDGGWKILNYEKYRKKMNEDERREYLRKKQQERRKTIISAQTTVNNVNKCQQMSTMSTQAEAEAEAEAYNTKAKALVPENRENKKKVTTEKQVTPNPVFELVGSFLSELEKHMGEKGAPPTKSDFAAAKRLLGFATKEQILEKAKAAWTSDEKWKRENVRTLSMLQHQWNTIAVKKKQLVPYATGVFAQKRDENEPKETTCS